MSVSDPCHRKRQVVEAHLVGRTGPDFLALQHAPEGQAREVVALIAVEYLWFAVARQYVFEGFDTERNPHRGRHPSGKSCSAEPVEYRHEVGEARSNGDKADAGRLGLIEPGNWHLAQQIGIDFVFQYYLRGICAA